MLIQFSQGDGRKRFMNKEKRNLIIYQVFSELCFLQEQNTATSNPGTRFLE